MNVLEKAKLALATAEAELQALISEALKAGQYEEIAQIAGLARALRDIMKQQGAARRAVFSAVSDAAIIQHHSERNPAPQRVARRSDSNNYPQFVKESDRLIKQGWSKKEKVVYEHKAPIAVARCVSLQLAQATGLPVFRMEDHFPFVDPDGEEIPTYQSYLVLAWLRHLTLIEKSGKDGYRWVTDAFDEESFQRVWNATPGRPTSERGGDE